MGIETSQEVIIHQLKKNLLALAIGLVGYFCAYLINFPAPALTGPALFVSIAALFGAKVDVHIWLRNVCFLFIGIAMGTGVTPQVVEAAKQWPESFLLLGANVLLTFFVCRHLLERYWAIDRETSTLAATPGHMSYILSLSVNSSADIATVSVVQSIRVLALTLAVPLIVTALGYQPAAIADDQELVSLTTLALILSGSVLCALIFEKVHLAAAYLLAGMFVSSAVFVTGRVSGAMPEYIYLPTIIIMGSLIGTRLSGVTWNILRNAVKSGLLLMFIAIALSSALAAFYAHWSGLPFGQLLIAFAPGGLETMIAMSLLLDADPAHVAAHHVWRLIVLTILAPMMLAKKTARKR